MRPVATIVFHLPKQMFVEYFSLFFASGSRLQNSFMKQTTTEQLQFMYMK